MASEMTTAEMVTGLRDAATGWDQDKQPDLANELRAVADRLEALDKVAKMLYEVMTDKSEKPSVVMTFDRARQWMEFRSAMKDVGHDPLPPLPAADAHDASRKEAGL